MSNAKYRGKRVSDGDFVVGNLVNAVNGKVYIVTMWDNTGTYEDRPRIMFVEVVPETVGQYTGMKDNNGVEIYEGDIVEAWSQGIKGRGEIKQRNDGLWIFYPAWQSKRFWGLMPSIDGIAGVEVIVNIHDNPELLEVRG